MQPVGELAAFLGGFVAAEGCFTGTGGRRFAFAIGLSSADEELCHRFPAWFGVGAVRRHPRRQPHHQDQVTYRVDALADLVEVIVPFMDEHLPPSHKRGQYLAWRADLLACWEHGARRRR